MIYDCFMYNGEKDILDIRMNILDKYVDYFVIGEARETFSGIPKPLYWNNNNPRVIHIVVPDTKTDNAFERAAFQKDYIRNALKDCKPEDTIYYGDVDEIWKPQKEEGKLRQINYCYFLNNRSSEVWEGTNVFKYKNIKNLNEIRADHSNILEDGGWHFTNMGGPDFIRRKLEAYDHQEFNNDAVKSSLEAKIEAGEDYVGRSVDWQGKPFYYWFDEIDLPSYILDNKEKYAHLFK